jgi:prepilin-type N-terminal cleavage/methylation domain-containing protein
MISWPGEMTMVHRRGYTLFELMLVITIMLMVGALAAPLVFMALHNDTKVQAAADMVRARWADCRYQAVEENRPYVFMVVPNTGKFKIMPYVPNQNGAPPAQDNTDNPGFTIEDRLPEGVRFGTKDQPVNADIDEPDGGEYVPIAIFLADGTAQDDVEITFGAKNSNNVMLRLRALTGAVTTIRNQEDGK